MISVKHTINLVTEFDETHPIALRFLDGVPESEQSEFLARMFEGLLIQEGFLDSMNENATYATIKVDN